jgi:hypothetical protein
MGRRGEKAELYRVTVSCIHPVYYEVISGGFI